MPGENNSSYPGTCGDPRGSVIEPEQWKLMVRLQRGQAFIKSLNIQLEEAFELWNKLENVLRETYEYRFCIYGINQRCPADAVCVCTVCAHEIFKDNYSSLR